MGTPDHLTCILSLYAGQEATVRTGHGTTDWFQIGKGVCQGCILSSCLFNLYAEYIMRNARLDEAQAGIKIAGRRASWWKWKRRVKKLAWNSTLKKTKIMTPGPISSCQIEGEKVETVADFLELQNHCRWDGDCCHEIKRYSLLWRKAMTNLDSVLKSRDIT